MFFNDKSLQTQKGRPIEDLKKSFSREEFFDTTDKKIYINRVRKEYLKNKILFDINLEERRCKLRKILETETDQFINENLNKMETIEMRKTKLINEAVRIRNETELERQLISTKKSKELQQKSDDCFRQNQLKTHTMLIKEDWNKLKDFDRRLKRENECENYFWKEKSKEITDDLIAKENIIKNKKNDFKNVCLEQINLNEKERNILKDLEKENIKNNLVRSNIFNEQLRKENIQTYNNLIEEKKNYHQILDKHIELGKIMKNKNKKFENSFDKIMDDENTQKLAKKDQTFLFKKQNEMKSLTNFIDYNNCLKKKEKYEDCLINQNVIKIECEIDKKRKEIEYEKFKKYQDLISEIKVTQKNQIVEAKEKKKLQKIEELKDKELFNKLYLEGIKEDQLKLVERKKIMQSYNNDLKSQIVYNEDLKEIRQMEHNRERKSMEEAENEYLNMRNESISNKKLLNMHPWRIK